LQAICSIEYFIYFGSQNENLNFVKYTSTQIDRRTAFGFAQRLTL